MKVARRDLDLGELTAIVERAAQAHLSAAERDKLQAALDTLAFLTTEIGGKGMTIERLRRMLFGARTEKTDKIFPEAPKEPDAAGAPPRGDAPPVTPAHRGPGARATDATGRRRLPGRSRSAWCTARCTTGSAAHSA